MRELPHSWATAPLGAFTIDCGQRVPEEAEEFKYIDIGSVNRETKRIETPQQLLGKDAPSRARKHVKAGDVLVSMTRPNLNAVALVPDELDGQIASTGFDVLRAAFGIELRWVSYLVRTDAFVEAMSELVQGALYPAVRPRDIRGFVAPLAPINEQKRIADKLDAVLARVDDCRDRLDLIPAILKRFRQSVLAAATSGYLTEDFRNGEDYSPKQVLFSELVQDSLVGLVRSSVEQFETGNDLTRYLKMNNISEGWGVNLMNVVQVRCSPQEAERYALKVGDWLFNTRNSIELVGKSCVWKGGHFVFNNNILRVRFNDSVVPDFIEIWFRSPTGRRNLNLVKSATTSVAAIYQRSLVAQVLEIPAVEEQTEIVRRVEALFACADRLEARYTAARAQVEKLTPATLSKAFRGELVPQDPNDEPASVLLARIHAQHNEPRAGKPSRSRREPG